MTPDTDYHSYLLRVWRDESRGIWHASLQSTGTKNTHHFSDVESLVHFLAVQQPDHIPNHSPNSFMDDGEGE